MEKKRTYIAIDLKSFYASVECKERNRDPFIPALVFKLLSKLKKDLKLSDRIYKCDCGNVIDRDFQASINLKAYGERVAS